jgi:hypothetical protein
VIPTLCFAACAWHGPVPIPGVEGASSSPFVVAMDRAAYNRVSLVSQAARTLEDGRIEVAVTLRNDERAELPIHLDVRFETAVAEGADPDAPVRVETSWKTVHLAAGANETVTVTSSAPGASAYTVELWAR